MTLVELMMGLAIGALVITAAGAALFAICDSTSSNGAYIKSRNAANASLTRMLTHVQRARKLTLLPTTSTNNTYTELITWDEAQWDPTASDWSATGAKYTRFRLVGSQLEVGQGTGDPATIVTSPVLPGVSDLTFRSVKTGAVHQSVNISITVAAPGPDSMPFSLSGSALCRTLFFQP